MDAAKGIANVNGTCLRALLNALRTSRSALFFLSLFLLACASMPAIASDDCESYGVAENHSPMGTTVHIEPLYRDELKVRCAGVNFANAATGTEIAGCSIPHENGMVEAYYWVGDKCAMKHELCHAQHGLGHTERYTRELQAGVPMPYCPSNQLAFNKR